MKKTGLLAVSLCLMLSCQTREKTNETVTVLYDDLVFPESVLVHENMILVTSFGTSELDPLNREGKGYILCFEDSDTVAVPFLRGNGIFSAPKGTRIHNGKLYVADVHRLIVFNMENLRAEPVIHHLPEEELFVNDMDLCGNELFLTVTNTGNVFRMNTSDPEAVPSYCFTVPGANGIVIDGTTAYIASYPPDGVTREENTLYRVTDILHSEPKVDKLIERPGQYDGLAFSDDKKILYFTNWTGAEVAGLDLETLEILPVDTGEIELAGPARIVQRNSRLYIPDMPNNRIVIVEL